MKKIRLIVFVLFLIFSFIPLIWFKSDFINGGDFSFPMASVLPVLINYVSIWTDKWGLGLLNSRALPQAPFQFFLGLLNLLHFSPQVIERIVFILFFGLSGFGMYLLVNCLPIQRKRYGVACFAALFYMFNPFNIIFYWHILDGMIFAYVFLVLILVAYLKWFLTKKKIYGVLFFLVTFFAGYTYSNPLMIPITWLTLFVFQFLIISPLQKEISLKESIKFFLRALLLWSLFNAWWFLPLLGSLKDEYAGLSTTIGSPWNTLRTFSLKTSFLNIFRLSDLYWAFGDPYYTYANTYQSALFKFISMVIPIIVFIPLLFRKYRSFPIVILSFITLVYMFLIKGIHPPGGEFLYRFLFKIPFMSAFRAPIHKLGVLLSINYAILFGYGISIIYDILRKRKEVIAKATIFFLLFLVLVIYSYPLWTGEVIPKGSKSYPAYQVKVPQDYSRVKEFFENKSGLWRFYSLPQSPTFNVAYNWEYGYIGTDPQFNLFPEPGVYSTVDIVAQLPYVLLRDSQYNEIYKILRLMNVEYLIMHRDVDEKLWDIFANRYRPISYLQKRMAEQKGIVLEKSFDKLDLYKISDEYFLPHIYLSINPIIVDGNIIDTFVPLAETTYVDGKPVLLFAQQKTENRGQITEIIERAL